MDVEKLSLGVSQREGKGWYEQIEVIFEGTGEWCGSLLVEYSASEGHAGESLFDDYSVRSIAPRCGTVLCSALPVLNTLNWRKSEFGHRQVGRNHP
ncbi:MAG: hypothetical protein CMJ81_17400 [Planctomycetaceae bacterium]|jgi:hypothetical protein|nr:hypothetical protein [Planctomycetaceae bacterium]MBP63733.1 hypothetical protein [Planctomycetaceae bacterium]